MLLEEMQMDEWLVMHNVHINLHGTIHANTNGVCVHICKQVLVIVVFVLNCHGISQFGIPAGTIDADNMPSHLSATGSKSSCSNNSSKGAVHGYQMISFVQHHII